MKWFQHDTDSTQDAKIRKLILRHGAEGYAVYFHCLELIAGTITKSNINFELEHDAEIIADVYFARRLDTGKEFFFHMKPPDKRFIFAKKSRSMG